MRKRGLFYSLLGCGAMMFAVACGDDTDPPVTPDTQIQDDMAVDDMGVDTMLPDLPAIDMALDTVADGMAPDTAADMSADTANPDMSTAEMIKFFDKSFEDQSISIKLLYFWRGFTT